MRNAGIIAGRALAGAGTALVLGEIGSRASQGARHAIEPWAHEKLDHLMPAAFGATHREPLVDMPKASGSGSTPEVPQTPPVDYAHFKGSATDHLILRSLEHLRGDIHGGELTTATAQDASTMAANMENALNAHHGKVFHGAHIVKGELIIKDQTAFDKWIDEQAVHAKNIHHHTDTHVDERRGAENLGDRDYTKFLKALHLSDSDIHNVGQGRAVIPHGQEAAPVDSARVVEAAHSSDGTGAHTNAEAKDTGVALDTLAQKWDSVVRSPDEQARTEFVKWATMHNTHATVFKTVGIFSDEKLHRLADEWAGQHNAAELGTTKNHNAFNKWILKEIANTPQSSNAEQVKSAPEAKSAAPVEVPKPAAKSVDVPKAVVEFPIVATAEHPIVVVPDVKKGGQLIAILDEHTGKSVQTRLGNFANDYKVEMVDGKPWMDVPGGVGRHSVKMSLSKDNVPTVRWKGSLPDGTSATKVFTIEKDKLVELPSKK